MAKSCCAMCRRPCDPSCRLCDDCEEAEREALGSRCQGCGAWQPDDVLESGYCPGCVDDCLCRSCRRPCDPAFGLCDDCEAIERDALSLDEEP